MRDRLVHHHYFDINLDVLWSTVTVDLPALLEVVPEPSDDEQPAPGTAAATDEGADPAG